MTDLYIIYSIIYIYIYIYTYTYIIYFGFAEDMLFTLHAKVSTVE